MSTELHKTAHGLPVHDDVTFEPRDINPGQIVRYLLYLAVAVALSFFICWFVYKATTKMALDSDTPLMPVWQTLTPEQRQQAVMPPEPRLQGIMGHDNDPQEDLRLKVRADREANERLGWVDEKQGIAQIPVEDAMKIIAEKGLGGAPVAAAPQGASKSQ